MNTTPNQKVFNILLVEDNAADRKLLTYLFQDCAVPYFLHLAKDGEEAEDFLYQRGEFAASPIPDLVLLDLNMPNKDGREVLREIKSHPVLKKIPVVILTTSNNATDVALAYDYQANSFIQKPRDLDKFKATVKLIEQYWLSTVELPRINPG